MTTKKPDARDEKPEARESDRENHQRLTRRRALAHLGAVTGLAGVGTYLSMAPSHWPGSLADPDGERGKPIDVAHRLPEGGFAIDANSSLADIGIARGLKIDAMVRSSVDAIGGIRRFIATGDVVVIKPNVAFGRAAALGATTNPVVLDSLIRLVKEAGASEVRVADNPIESPEDCFARTGIRQAATDAGARVYLPNQGSFETINVPNATWIERWPFFWRPFRGADKVIGVSPCKDHNLCRASMTTKNWYGLLGGRRNQFHQDIHGIIADLALMLRPTFVVLDGTRVMFRSGPTGGSLDDVRMGHTIAASTDSLAVDAWGWDDLLGRKSEEKPKYLALAAERGLGQPNYAELELKEEQIG